VSQPVSVGIHVPSSAVAALDSGDAYVEFFQQVEALGLDAVWTEDRIFHDASMLDPLMLLAAVPPPSSPARSRPSTISPAGASLWACRSAVARKSTRRSACR
jgi:hypothetical protein